MLLYSLQSLAVQSNIGLNNHAVCLPICLPFQDIYERKCLIPAKFDKEAATTIYYIFTTLEQFQGWERKEITATFPLMEKQAELVHQSSSLAVCPVALQPVSKPHAPCCNPATGAFKLCTVPRVDIGQKCRQHR